ncbi:MAG: hypothetical protein ABSD42_06895 [Candidatus Bathyarchaeia archaeon]|jgi:hypothetical protein
MRKRLVFALAAAIIVAIVVSAFAAIEIYKPFFVTSKKPFYVGVTYCGDSAVEAEQLINRVKNYTNLFVLDSGTLIGNVPVTEQICDYAVNAGLNVILYYSNNNPAITCDSLITIAQARWGSHFLGLYYDDELGGKMLDGIANLYSSSPNETISKGQDGSLYVQTNNLITNSSTTYDFLPSGEIEVDISQNLPDSFEFHSTFYYLNGTISYTTKNCSATDGTVTSQILMYQPDGTVQTDTGAVVTDAGNISQFEPYQKLLDSRPIQTYAQAANSFVSYEQSTLGSIGNQSDVKLFTSDYALDWFDYQGGYDVVLAQLGWNQSTTQNIALVRGAADMHDKSWGAMITWESQSAPYLQSGSQMYSEMKQAYEGGAEYVVVFNFASDIDSTAGLLQDQHYSALQSFWTDVVQNSSETNNVKAQDALVLPNDYGWGMRNPNDNIWGMWHNNSSQQVWNALQASLSQYGSKLDIVYEDPAYPTAGRYQHVYYWNQTT